MSEERNTQQCHKIGGVDNGHLDSGHEVHMSTLTSCIIYNLVSGCSVNCIHNSHCFIFEKVRENFEVIVKLSANYLIIKSSLSRTLLEI